MTAPGWYPDPQGRHAQRYYDGTRWTEQVGGPAPGGGRAGRAGGPGKPNVPVLVAIGVGALLMVLGLFAFSWVPDQDAGLSDIRDLVSQAEEFGVDPPGIVGPYYGFGIFLATFGTLVVATAAVFVPGTAKKVLGAVAGIGGVIAVIAHFVAADDLLDGLSDFGAGFWAVAVGLTVTAVAAVAAVVPRTR